MTLLNLFQTLLKEIRLTICFRAHILIAFEVMSEKVCKILLVLSPMLGFPKHGGNL